MASITKSKEIQYDMHRVNNQTHIYVCLEKNPRGSYISWNTKTAIRWIKYQIKETDMRQKTATFSSPDYLDLSHGIYDVLITSPYHEDFGGIVLSCEYNDDTGVYDYQCQDFSRKYQLKSTSWANSYNGHTINTYTVLQNLITRSGISWIKEKQTSEKLKEWSRVLSGLRPIDDYDQEKWGSIVKFNPMKDPASISYKDKSYIDLIRTFVFGAQGYIDVYFDKYGIIQIEPYQKNDFYNTGVHLRNRDVASFKPKFDMTNFITTVRVNIADKTNSSLEYGEWYNSTIFSKYDLRDFYGLLGTTIADPNAQNNTATTNNTVSTTAKKTTTTTPENPYISGKGKKAWINADGGSGTIKNQIANALKRKGWSVHVSGTGPGYHYTDYFNCAKDNVLLMIMNGFCVGSMIEAYSSKIQNVLKKKNVVLVPIWHTAGWTNPRGMGPYRYGNFNGYKASRAWDDNFSSGNPYVSNVGAWLKKNNAKYCCHPTLDGIMNQFYAGGYFALNNK